MHLLLRRIRLVDSWELLGEHQLDRQPASGVLGAEAELMLGEAALGISSRPDVVAAVLAAEDVHPSHLRSVSGTGARWDPWSRYGGCAAYSTDEEETLFAGAAWSRYGGCAAYSTDGEETLFAGAAWSRYGGFAA